MVAPYMNRTAVQQKMPLPDGVKEIHALSLIQPPRQDPQHPWIPETDQGRPSGKRMFSRACNCAASTAVSNAA